MSLGARIKELRLKKGVSLQSVADNVGASKPHIWELERGTTKNPSLNLLTKLTNYYGVSVDSLAGLEAKNSDTESIAFARRAEKKGYSVSDLQKLLEAAELLRSIDKDVEP